MTNEANKTHKHYLKLLKAYKLQLAEDVHKSLREEADNHIKISWESFGNHLTRMRNYLLDSSLNEDRKEYILQILDLQQGRYLTFLDKPETRALIVEGDRRDLRDRRTQLLSGFAYGREEARLQELEDSVWETYVEKAVKEINRRLDILDTQPHKTTWPKQPIPHVSAQSPADLAPAYTAAQAHHMLRWRQTEFRNIVNISFSTPDDDALVTVYDSANLLAAADGYGLWCPVMTDGRPFETWLSFTPKRREAIRMGFMRGLSNYIEHPMSEADGLAVWLEKRPEIQHRIFTRFNRITDKAHSTGDSFEGWKSIDALLQTIYDCGQHIPYHPNFEKAFLEHLGQVALHEMDDFLAGLCQNKRISTPSDYEYLLSLVTNALRTVLITSHEAIDRALIWLRDAYKRTIPEDTSTMSSTQGIATAPPCILSLAKLDEIAIAASLVKEEDSKPTPISGTTASALWGMVEILEATTVINPGGKSKLALWLADRYAVKMRDKYDGPNDYSITRTNAWLTCGNALVALDLISESQRIAAMTQLNSKKNKKSKPKVG